jgi:hypothetical protein
VVQERDSVFKLIFELGRHLWRPPSLHYMQDRLL